MCQSQTYLCVRGEFVGKEKNWLIKAGITVCKLFYGALILFSLFSIITRVFQIVTLEDSTMHLVKLGNTSIALTQYCVALFIFVLIGRVYQLFQKQKQNQNYIIYLKKIAYSLYCVAVLDAIYLIYNYLFKIDYKGASSELYTNENLIITIIKNISDNGDFLKTATLYLLPRPSGFFAAILGFSILYAIQVSKSTKSVNS